MRTSGVRAGGGDDQVGLRGRQARYTAIGARLGAGDDVYRGSASASEQYVDAGDGSAAGYGTERARVAGFESVQVDRAAFTTLRVRGTARADDLRIERGRTASLGRIDVDLGAGDDSVGIVARGNLEGRVTPRSRARHPVRRHRGRIRQRRGPQGAFSGSLATGVFRVDGHRLRASGVNDLLARQFRTVKILGSAASNFIQVQGVGSTLAPATATAVST